VESARRDRTRDAETCNAEREETMKPVVVVLVLAAAAGAVWYFWLGGGTGSSAQTTRFRTAKVDRGEVVEGVQASGTVQPVLLVQVGTQVSGVIDKMLVDFNSKVKAGQTIAMLDTRRLDAQVAQDNASIARAKADLVRVQAVLAQSRTDVDRVKAAGAQAASDVLRAQALLTQAQKDLERQKTLAERHLTAASDLDAAVANEASLGAQLASAKAAVDLNAAQIASSLTTVQQNEAQVLVSEAAIRQSEAQLLGDKVNLDYATITSPVDGVVVSRNVDVGQTVAASLSAPTLFVIANDLTKIQVQTSVPEADIGKLREGQKARFTVDAYQDRTGERSFEGTVSQVRLASTTVQNVVTYTVIVDAANPQGLLLPGMTATVTFEIQRSSKDALTVSASALRLQAPPDLVDNPEVTAPKMPAADAAAAAKPADTTSPDAKADAPKPPEDGKPPREGRTPGDGAAAAAGGEKPAGDHQGAGAGKRMGGGGRRGQGFVYLLTPANKLHAIPVKIGISDGVHTVVEPADPAALPEGAEVVTAVMRDEEPATTNPFAPPRPGSTGTRPAGGGGR
jgi:HlyD family secretion protein